ncbi:MAG: hypothetical protein JXA92_02115 [candidate division Zixibacteria bacterium]|nr:hypothetical protein [candidate division Zixibacteria bacterium]
MAEENIENPEVNEKNEESPKIRGGLMKYVIYGAAGLVLVLAIAFGTVFLMGGSDSEVADTLAGETAAVEDNGTPSKETGSTQPGNGEGPNDDSLLAELEAGNDDVLEKIMDNLAFLDYEPNVGEVGEEETSLSVEDSIETVNWLEQEKKRLTEKEKELDAREKELNVMDKKVTQKILKIEQAESTRISNLARLYDGMDSRAVARLMANLDDATVVAILPRMKQKNASAVLQLMPSQRAAKLSKQMITIAEN